MCRDSLSPGLLLSDRQTNQDAVTKTVGIVSMATACLVALGVLYLVRGKCAGERWSVKTLSDRDRSRVRLRPVFATVEQLRALAPPRELPQDRRVPPVELTTYVVKARVVGTDKMWDRDFHLVISSLHDRSLTMIAEFVDPVCAESARRPCDSRKHARPSYYCSGSRGLTSWPRMPEKWSR
jgi:hypothetical protein